MTTCVPMSPGDSKKMKNVHCQYPVYSCLLFSFARPIEILQVREHINVYLMTIREKVMQGHEMLCSWYHMVTNFIELGMHVFLNK